MPHALRWSLAILLLCVHPSCPAAAASPTDQVSGQTEPGKPPSPESRQAVAQAAAADDPKAMNAFGAILLSEGDGAAARGWFDKAVKAGNADALNNIGVMYANSVGVGDDGIKASRTWFEKAQAKGCPAAAFNLGLLFHHGSGVPVDAPAARKWYAEAAKAGHAKAAFNLGAMLAKGEGGAADPAQAKILFRQAEKGGVPQAADFTGAKPAAKQPTPLGDFLLATPLGADVQPKPQTGPSSVEMPPIRIAPSQAPPLGENAVVPR